MIRSFASHAWPAVALMVAGVVVLALTREGTVMFLIGFTAVGIGAVLLVALAFYEVGRSEDADREAESRRSGGS